MFGISLHGPDDPSKPACRCQPSVLRHDAAFYALLVGWYFFLMGCEFVSMVLRHSMTPKNELIWIACVTTGVLGVFASVLVVLWGYAAADRRTLRQGSYVVLVSSLLVHSVGYTERADERIVIALSAAFVGFGVLLFIRSFFKKESR